MKLATEHGTVCGSPAADGSYVEHSYGQMKKDSISIGNALKYYGLKAKKGSVIDYIIVTITTVA